MQHSEADCHRASSTDSGRNWGGLTEQPVDVVNAIPQERVRWHRGKRLWTYPLFRHSIV